jgi:7-carboxy-7-deazaguanine synthase
MSSISYPVMEHFYTLQGEGYYTGQAAYFVRLAGCDVGCVWCDVKESWDASKHPSMKLEEIVDAICQTPTQIVVITGGEPLLHDLTALCNALQTKGIRTHIETSGSSPLSGTWDWICLSPKKFKAALPESIAAADELKVIIFNQSDFDWALQYQAKVKSTCKLYLQTEWDQQEKMLPKIIEFVKQNPKWQISLQTHKYMQIP